MNILEARRRTLGGHILKKTAQGNPAIATDSLARMHPGIEMKGWTEQKSTTGAQLLDLSNTVDRTDTTHVLTDTGLTVTGLFYVSALVDVNPNTDMYISYEKSGDGANIVSIYNSTGLASDDRIATYATQGGTFNTGDNSQINVLFYSGQGTSSSSTYSNVMLNEGTGAKPYEPYTGGAPSPSPDYPQEIVSAGTYNSETHKWEYEVKIQGKNLFDFSKIISSGTYMSVDYEKQTITIPAHVNNAGYKNTLRDVVPDAIVGMTCVIDAQTSNPEGQRAIYFLNSRKAVGFGNPFVITNDLLNDYFAWHNNIDTNNKNIISEIQIEYGDTPTDYESYKEPQTLTFQSDRPLTKWDKLTKKNGVWGWEYGSAEIVLDGSEDENFSIYEMPNEGKSFAITLNDSAGGYQTSLCDKYRNVNYAWASYHKGKYAIYSDHSDVTNRRRYFRPPSAEIETIEQWKTWLQSNPLTLLYEAKEETFEPFDVSQQEILNAIHTYNPSTSVFNWQNCDMDFTYKTRKSVENYE